MRTTSYPNVPAAGIGRPMQKPACTQDALASISGLLTDARASLDSDRELAYSCLVQAVALLRQGSESPAPDRKSHGGLARWQIKRLTAYIDEHLGSTIRTSHLAATLALSTSHFSHAFKRATGVPPRAYVARRRIEAACAMMLETDEPLTRIAHLHGFCDQSHFTRTFRREIGMVPQAWRRIRVQRDTTCPAQSGNRRGLDHP